MKIFRIHAYQMHSASTCANAPALNQSARQCQNETEFEETRTCESRVTFPPDRRDHRFDALWCNYIDVTTVIYHYAVARFGTKMLAC